MDSTPIRRASLAVDLYGDEHAHHVEAFDFSDEGQAQITDAEGRWTLHVCGTVASFRHLATAIAGAADELELRIAAAQVSA